MHSAEVIRKQTGKYISGYINGHSRRIRGGDPLFPETDDHVKNYPLREMPGNLYQDLTKARGDGRSFGVDSRAGRKPISHMKIFKSLPYGDMPLGGDTIRYQRMAVIFGNGKVLAAICNVFDDGNVHGPLPDPYRLNKGVLFLPESVVAFDNSEGQMGPINMPNGAIEEWIERFLGEELYELESTVSPEVDNFRMNATGAFVQQAESLGMSALHGAANILFGRPAAGDSYD